ncbi:MAG TPA: class I SAM-dependent methyltransferase [Anaerolineae bacterium]|nr:class I SAM-dependent methyltransferase [Anaerolineae bacterium]HID84012.1 class I SAM-dependent methyltransferase [Anaerolineales bacterium]HIQ09806.1 class I SAM-dependent methyltransferase [Anaerolineaceae bacterium]
MSGYDPIAPIYDRYWGAFSVRRFLPVLERWLLPNPSPEAWVLDLGCGTEALAQVLTQRGCRVLGINLSPSMIRQAYERLPAGRALVADMRALPLASRFHAVYAVFASLNHLLTPEHLNAAFQSVARTLRPGGWFLFDLNTEDDYHQR